MIFMAIMVRKIIVFIIFVSLASHGTGANFILSGISSEEFALRPPASGYPAENTGALDGLTILRFLHTNRPGFGLTRHIENLDNAFQQARGDIFKTLREAESYAFEKTTLAKATGKRFASQLKAYMAAKDIYKTEQRLLTFEESLENVRKYVVVADSNDTQVFIVDVQEKLTPSL